jgi:hypothetical protein
MPLFDHHFITRRHCVSQLHFVASCHLFIPFLSCLGAWSGWWTVASFSAGINNWHSWSPWSSSFMASAFGHVCLVQNFGLEEHADDKRPAKSKRLG